MALSGRSAADASAIRAYPRSSGRCMASRQASCAAGPIRRTRFTAARRGCGPLKAANASSSSRGLVRAARPHPGSELGLALSVADAVGEGDEGRGRHLRGRRFKQRDLDPVQPQLLAQRPQCQRCQLDASRRQRSGGLTAPSAASSLSSQCAGSPCPRTQPSHARLARDDGRSPMAPLMTRSLTSATDSPDRLARKSVTAVATPCPWNFSFRGGARVRGSGHVERSGQQRGEDDPPHVERARIVTVRPAPRGVPEHRPGPVAAWFALELQPSGREGIVQQVRQVLRLDVQPRPASAISASGARCPRVTRRPSRPSHRGQRLQLGHERRGPRQRREPGVDGSRMPGSLRGSLNTVLRPAPACPSPPPTAGNDPVMVANAPVKAGKDPVTLAIAPVAAGIAPVRTGMAPVKAGNDPVTCPPPMTPMKRAATSQLRGPRGRRPEPHRAKSRRSSR